MAKIITKICNALTILILICVLAIVGVLLIPRLAGYETFAVLSGSMEPYYHVGSVVFVDKSVTPEEVKVGDPITFTKTDTLVATHRVIDIDSANGNSVQREMPTQRKTRRRYPSICW